MHDVTTKEGRSAYIIECEKSLAREREAESIRQHEMRFAALATEIDLLLKSHEIRMAAWTDYMRKERIRAMNDTYTFSA